MTDFVRAVGDCLSAGFRDVDIETEPGNGRLLAWIGAHGEVLSRHFANERVTIHCRLPAAMLGRIAPAEAVVRMHVSPSERSPSERSPVHPSVS